MKKSGINFFQHWKRSLVFDWLLFFVLNMFMVVASRSGCTGMATASVMPKGVSFSSAWMPSLRCHRLLLRVSFRLMCARMRHVPNPIF